MIFARVSILRHIFGERDDLVADFARRWRKAFADEPELANDLIRMGGLITLQLEAEDNGKPRNPCPYREMIRRGRRELAIEFLAGGGMTYSELNTLMETET